MQTYTKKQQKYKEYENVNARITELNLSDILELLSKGVIFEEDFSQGQIVQVNCITLEIKIQPGDEFFRMLKRGN